MRGDLLNQLADFLSTIPEKDRKDGPAPIWRDAEERLDKIFSMSTWSNVAFIADKCRSKRDLSLVREYTPEFDCGFAGCAMGWAAHAKLFPGLELYLNGVCYYPGQDGHHYYDYQAAEQLFELTTRQAEWLFSPEFNHAYTAQQVANKIREFIMTGGVCFDAYHRAVPAAEG